MRALLKALRIISEAECPLMVLGGVPLLMSGQIEVFGPHQLTAEHALALRHRVGRGADRTRQGGSMTSGVNVDPAILWAASSATRTVADETDQQLKSTEAAMAGCGTGWGPTSRAAFDGLLDHLGERRRALFEACGQLGEGLAMAAHEYEQADTQTQVDVVSAARPDPSRPVLQM